jgi:nucleoside-diphosphate-sugar epimerase
LIWQSVPSAICEIEKSWKYIFEISVPDLEQYQQVVFLAGLSNDPMAEYSASENFIFHAAAPAYLARVAKKAKVKRYVYASSCSVYGYTVNELFDETRLVSSFYPYGISKLQGEQAAMNLVDDEFSVISLRKGAISGHSPRMRLDLIVNTMLRTECATARSRSTTLPSGARS